LAAFPLAAAIFGLDALTFAAGYRMSPMIGDVSSALELVHDGWFLLICICAVSASLSILAVKTRENGEWEALVMSRVFLLLFAVFWTVVCIQGWNDIQAAYAENSMFWLKPFLPIFVALLVAGGTFFIRPSANKDN
jgi:hypothetical protein